MLSMCDWSCGSEGVGVWESNSAVWIAERIKCRGSRASAMLVDGFLTSPTPMIIGTEEAIFDELREMRNRY